MREEEKNPEGLKNLRGLQAEICLTPELIHLTPPDGKLVVVVDILRATSCMVAGLGSGIKSITPVETVEECLAYREQGYLCAGERGGEKIPEFDLGNSPFEYMAEEVKGRSIAVSTTNGTRAIKASAGASDLIIGSFLNLNAVAEYVSESQKELLIHCAGWKGNFNLEDTLFAGALLKLVSSQYTFSSDSCKMAATLWRNASEDLETAIKDTAHAARLKNFGIEKDLGYCSRIDEFDVVPRLMGKKLVL